MTTHNGSCHCGTVTFTITGEIEKAVACNCSYCGRKGTLLAFFPESQFTLQSGADNLTEYRFNTKKITHLFCNICGVQGFGKGNAPDGTATVAINVRCLDDINLGTLPIDTFNGKDF